MGIALSTKLILFPIIVVFCVACSDSKKKGAGSNAGLLEDIGGQACSPSLTSAQCADAKAALKNDAIQLSAGLTQERRLIEAQLRRIESGKPDPQDIAGRPADCITQVETMRALRAALATPDGTVSRAGLAFLALDIVQTKPKLYSACRFAPAHAPDDVRLSDCQMLRRAAVALRKMQPNSAKDVDSKEESDAIPSKVEQMTQEIASGCGAPEAAVLAKEAVVVEQEQASLAGAISSDCQELSQSLAALRRMQNPAPGEILTQAERDALPAEIVKIEQNIASRCK